MLHRIQIWNHWIGSVKGSGDSKRKCYLQLCSACSKDVQIVLWSSHVWEESILDGDTPPPSSYTWNDSKEEDGRWKRNRYVRWKNEACRTVTVLFVVMFHSRSKDILEYFSEYVLEVNRNITCEFSHNAHTKIKAWHLRKGSIWVPVENDRRRQPYQLYVVSCENNCLLRFQCPWQNDMLFCD